MNFPLKKRCLEIWSCIRGYHAYGLFLCFRSLWDIPIKATVGGLRAISSKHQWANNWKALDLDILILPSWRVNSPLGRFVGWLSKRGNGLLSFWPFLSDEPSKRKWQQRYVTGKILRKSDTTWFIPPSV